MEILAGLPFVIAIIIFAIWICQQACQGVKSVGRTTRAIGEWNKKQLGEKDESTGTYRHSRKR